MTTEKKPRKPRRNVERELQDLKRYLEISIDLMIALNANLSGPVGDHMQGQIAALKAVLARLEQK